MKERRRWKRRQLIYYLKVFNTKDESLLGFLVDITASGLMLMSENPIPIHKIYHMHLPIESDLCIESNIHFTAKSLWNRNKENDPFVDTGFEITEMDPLDMDAIEQAINRLSFKGSDQF